MVYEWCMVWYTVWFTVWCRYDLCMVWVFCMHGLIYARTRIANLWKPFLYFDATASCSRPHCQYIRAPAPDPATRFQHPMDHSTPAPRSFPKLRWPLRKHFQAPVARSARSCHFLTLCSSCLWGRTDRAGGFPRTLDNSLKLA